MAWTLEKESADSLQSPRSNAPARIALAVAFFAGVLFLWHRWSVGATYIGAWPSGQSYADTRFEFRFGHCTRVVQDPYNQMQWVLGASPERIKVANDTRVVIYNSPGAIIKSRSDSINVLENATKFGGYMGVWSEAASFIVDSEGVVSHAQ